MELKRERKSIKILPRRIRDINPNSNVGTDSEAKSIKILSRRKWDVNPNINVGTERNLEIEEQSKSFVGAELNENHRINPCGEDRREISESFLEKDEIHHSEFHSWD